MREGLSTDCKVMFFVLLRNLFYFEGEEIKVGFLNHLVYC